MSFTCWLIYTVCLKETAGGICISNLFHTQIYWITCHNPVAIQSMRSKTSGVYTQSYSSYIVAQTIFSLTEKMKSGMSFA